MICEHCHEDATMVGLVIHDRELWCWPCHNATKGTVGKAACVIPDDIPGGLEIKHGLCNPDGSPRKYYSHTEINAEAKRRGMVNMVRHTDQDHHVKRWV